MTPCEEFINKASHRLPSLCKTKDLIALGLYTSEQAASQARRRGVAPDYFKLPHGSIVYPKEGILKFLKLSQHSQAELA